MEQQEQEVYLEQRADELKYRERMLAEKSGDPPPPGPPPEKA